MIPSRDIAILLVASILGLGASGCEQILGEPFGKKLALDGGHTASSAPAGLLLDASDEQTALFFAVRSLDFGEAGTTIIGFDIDQGAHCNRVPATGGLPAEGPDGKDNAAEVLTRDYEARRHSRDSISTTLSRGATAGVMTNIFRLSGYNGLADDPEVWFAAMTGGFAAEPDTAFDADAATSPRWDGRDGFDVDVGSVKVDGGRYRSRAEAKGAVKDFRLQIPREFVYSVGMVDATLDHSGTAWALDGTFGSVLEDRVYADIAARFSQCQIDFDAADAGADRRRLCATRDVTTDGRPGTCNGVSVGFTFDAVQMRFAGMKQYRSLCMEQTLDCSE